MNASPRLRVLFGCLALLLIALYLWPALSAPVVLWSDSRVDMEWAKEGFGLFRQIPLPPPGVPIGHLPKPGYLLFLRLAMNGFPWLGEPRSIVLTQSILLVLSILATSFWIGRRSGAWRGLLLLTGCFLFLRLRDASSAVMSETLAAALLLPMGALLLHPPRRPTGMLFLGLASGGLFLVRPNCGGVIVLIAIASLAVGRQARRLLLFVAGFVALALPFWYLGRSNLPGDPLHGLGFQIVEGSADYYWAPSIHPWPAGPTPAEAAAAESRLTRANWKATLASAEPDRSRQLAWRAFHGLLGIEYYDARWSRIYWTATMASRLLSPFLILAAIAVLLAARISRDGPAKLAGLLLLILLVGQDVLLGSNPRYALPFLPLTFLYTIESFQRVDRPLRRRTLAVAVVLGGLAFLTAWQRQVLDWQWGRVEKAGVTLLQRIPRRALPSRAPATLHVRLAAPDPESGAHWILSASGRTIASSDTTDRRSPVVSAEIPSWLIEENRQHAIEISLRSTGSYGDTSYLLFPVIAPPWASLARRLGSADLSPDTGIRWGALDWWAHPGIDSAPNHRD